MQEHPQQRPYFLNSSFPPICRPLEEQSTTVNHTLLRNGNCQAATSTYHPSILMRVSHDVVFSGANRRASPSFLLLPNKQKLSDANDLHSQTPLTPEETLYVGKQSVIQKVRHAERIVEPSARPRGELALAGQLRRCSPVRGGITCG